MKRIVELCLVAAVICLVEQNYLLAQGQLLKGTVEEQAEAETRIHRFDPVAGGDNPLTAPTRIHRANVTEEASQPVETPATRIHRGTQPTTPKMAELNPKDFAIKPAVPYDLESESNSRILMLAWERWHKQLTETIFGLFRSSGTGGCTYRLTVTRSHHISVEIVSSWGSPAVTSSLISTAMSLDGNLGLSFPGESKRQIAYDSNTLFYGPMAGGGIDWQRNDFERVRQNF